MPTETVGTRKRTLQFEENLSQWIQILDEKGLSMGHNRLDLAFIPMGRSEEVSLPGFAGVVQPFLSGEFKVEGCMGLRLPVFVGRFPAPRIRELSKPGIFPVIFTKFESTVSGLLCAIIFPN